MPLLRLRHTLRHMMHGPSLSALVIAGALASASAPSRLPAQAMSGAGDDAIPVARGAVRLRIAGQWNDWEDVFRDSAGRTIKRGLLAPLNNRTLGVSVLPQLRDAELAIQTLSRQSAFTLSLGTLEARGDVRQSTAPISVEYGVTPRLSVGLLIPYVESRDNAQLVLNRAGSGATVGVNPAFAGTSAAAARAANGTLLAQIRTARTQLAAEIARCAAPGATGCDAISRDPAAAQQLVQRATEAQGAIRVVYGDSARGGSPVVPFSQTLLGESINATILTLRGAFQQYGIESIDATALPAGATTAYGPGSLTALAADSAFGLAYRRLGNTRRAGIGDVDLTASFLLFDTFDANQPRRLTNTGRALRSLVTAGWRFGMAGADDPLDPFDVPIGLGANAVLLRSTTDLVLNRRFWVSGSVRLEKPFGDDMMVAVPLLTDSTLFAGFQVAAARRTFGARMELELAPRLALGDFFGISGAYLYRRTGSDGLRSDFASESSAPMLLERETGTRSFQAASVGITFSTLASYVRRRSRLPLEVMYTRSFPLAGSGGTVPAVHTDRLELRVYTGFPRR